jgi:hypothetical protein
MSTGHGGPLDETDAAILAQVQAAHAELDPPPPTLAEQAGFALDLADADAAVARLQDEALAGSGARGASRSRTLTFEATGMSLLVSVTELGDGRVRVDGWIAPPSDGRVELRRAARGAAAPRQPAVRRARLDAAGRFVFGGVAHGLAQLRIDPGGRQAGRPVITPPIRL